MRTPALAHQPSLETTLTVLSGPERGTVYRIVSSRVTLGRGSDNDIVIDDDPKVSRNHAEIVFGPLGFEIRDLTDRNYIMVDGQECKSAPIGDNSVFVLGGTQFRLSVRQLHTLPTAFQGSSATTVASAIATDAVPSNRTSTRPRQVKKKSLSLPSMLLIIAGVVLYLLFADTKAGGPKPTAEDLAEQEIKTAQSLKQMAEERRRPKNVSPNDIGYQQAQQAYLSGFRDYRKGQFERALASFRACLSLYPQHALCERYHRLSQRRFDELVQYHMVLGRKYRDQNQYSACATSFRNVMAMVKDAGNKRYQEAKANFEACSAQVEERF